jgi:hypothetical protein
MSFRNRLRGHTPDVDVLTLLDRLDDLVHDAKIVPLTNQVRIDRDEISDLVDQLRATIPEELKRLDELPPGV